MYATALLNRSGDGDIGTPGVVGPVWHSPRSLAISLGCTRNSARRAFEALTFAGFLVASTVPAGAPLPSKDAQIARREVTVRVVAWPDPDALGERLERLSEERRKQAAIDTAIRNARLVERFTAGRLEVPSDVAERAAARAAERARVRAAVRAAARNATVADAVSIAENLARAGDTTEQPYWVNFAPAVGVNFAPDLTSQETPIGVSMGGGVTQSPTLANVGEQAAKTVTFAHDETAEPEPRTSVSMTTAPPPGGAPRVERSEPAEVVTIATARAEREAGNEGRARNAPGPAAVLGYFLERTQQRRPADFGVRWRIDLALVTARLTRYTPRELMKATDRAVRAAKREGHTLDPRAVFADDAAIEFWLVGPVDDGGESRQRVGQGAPAPPPTVPTDPPKSETRLRAAKAPESRPTSPGTRRDWRDASTMTPAELKALADASLRTIGG